MLRLVLLGIVALLIVCFVVYIIFQTAYNNFTTLLFALQLQMNRERKRVDYIVHDPLVALLERVLKYSGDARRSAVLGNLMNAPFKPDFRRDLERIIYEDGKKNNIRFRSYNNVDAYCNKKALTNMEVMQSGKMMKIFGFEQNQDGSIVVILCMEGATPRTVTKKPRLRRGFSFFSRI